MNFGKLKMYVGGELIDSIDGSEKIIQCPANEDGGIGANGITFDTYI